LRYKDDKHINFWSPGRYLKAALANSEIEIWGFQCCEGRGRVLPGFRNFDNLP